jgi:hypothetical protein
MGAASQRNDEMRSIVGLGVLLLLAACGTPWSKPGVSQEKAAQDYSECRHAAEVAQRRDSAIDTDIMATRSQDWARLGILRVKRDDYSDSNEARSGDFVERCMIGKGYTSGA